MSGYGNRNSGKRQAAGGSGGLGEMWRQHRAWVAGLSRGGKIRYRLFLALGAVSLVIVILAAVLKAWIALPQIPHLPGHTGAGDSSVQVEGDGTFEGAQLPQVAKSGRRDGVYTFLVAGLDQASSSTDTMLLVTYDTKNKTIDAISLLRDTMINTSRSRGGQKRLNTVYNVSRGDRSLPDAERAKNGMTGLKQEVSKLTGIYPDFYVLVQWEAIGQLVDAIGGVYFEVPFDMDYDDPYQDLHIHQKAGYRLLNGQDAMEVIRFRKSNKGDPGYIALGDAGRTAIQRDFLVATIQQCLKPEIILKAPKLAEIFTQNVYTDLTIGNLLAFAQLAIGMDVEKDVKFVSMPWTGVRYDGADLVLPIQKELLTLLNDGINPYKDAIQASDLQLMYRKSDGSYGVTNASLKDPAMATPPPPKVEQPPETDDPLEPEEGQPGDPVSPGQEGEGGEPPAGGGDRGSSGSSESSGGSGDSGSGGDSGGGADPGSGDDPGDGGSAGDSGTSGEGGGTPPPQPEQPPVDPVFPNDPVLPGDPDELGLDAVLDPGAVFPDQAA